LLLEGKMRISQRVKAAVKRSGRRQYELARAIGVHHSTLSCWLCGISDVQDGDCRVVALGQILGVPASECFEESSDNEADGPDVLPAA
jgi:transcriptional regulator with XRE-family HTH domain